MAVSRLDLHPAPLLLPCTSWLAEQGELPLRYTLSGQDVGTPREPSHAHVPKLPAPAPWPTAPRRASPPPLHVLPSLSVIEPGEAEGAAARGSEKIF